MTRPFTIQDVEDYVRGNFEMVEDIPNFEKIEEFLCRFYQETEPEDYGDLTVEEMCWDGIVGESLSTCGEWFHGTVMEWVNKNF